ncbi:unnamed protein product [Rangifer tarandus platyrhynchus]|uniref:Uncharacterized protein n=1 Tax=Rangifer tarandus platyrhynchus TaxID=3082113 RepID=A0AC59YSX5_RANTA
MCPTLLSLLSLGFCVSLRIWAAVGEYEKPSLSALPSPVVPLGQTVTLRCHSRSPFPIFSLFKRDGTSLIKLQEHQLNTFTLGPVTREHAGSYTCSGFYWSPSVWSTHSGPLQIVVTGVFTKPSISAHPGPIVRAGGNVTIRCHSPLLLDKFMLHKIGNDGHFQGRGETFTGGHAPADFSIGPMTLASAGSYRCYGSLSRSPYEWSAPSDPVDIVITGWSKKPSLSAQGGPMESSGENVTLLCSSKHPFHQFHLIREGENLGRLLAGGRGPHGALQAEFPLGPGTPAHSGVYRCYGSFNHSPYAWSDASDPLLLSVTGEYDKPSLSAWPSPVVPLGQTVTLQCHSRSPFAIFRLFKRDGTSLTKLQEHQLNTFTLGPVTREHAGSYTCSGFYWSLSVWFTHSDPLQILVTGVFTKPAISAHPGPLMKAGGNVTLRCHSPLLFDKFILHQDNSTGHFQTHGETFMGGHASADFSIGPMTSGSAGTYRCYGSLSHSPYEWSAPSDPVDIVMTGVFTKPAISAHPGPLMKAGGNVTLRCHSPLLFDKFILHQENSTGHFQTHGETFMGGHASADFSIGPMTSGSAGTYRCYGSLSHSPYEWSAPSDPVDIVMTGLSKKPSLSAQRGPVVRSGEDVTLLCSSERAFDQFHLLREGENLGRLLAGGWGPRGALQAEFPLGPGTPAHSGVYRCYGSFSHSPYMWSDPSDPLLLSVTGNSSSSQPLQTKPNSSSSNPRHLHALVGPSLAFVFLVSLISFLAHHWCRDAKDAAIMNSQPEVGRRVNREDPDTEELNEVTYTDLDCSVFTWKNITPTSQRPREPSADASVYMDLATC